MGGGGVGGGGISFASVCVQGIEVLLYPSSSSQGFPLAQTDTDKKNFRFPLLKGEKQCQFFEMRIFSLSLTRRCSIGHALAVLKASEREREEEEVGSNGLMHAGPIFPRSNPSHLVTLTVCRPCSPNPPLLSRLLSLSFLPRVSRPSRV